MKGVSPVVAEAKIRDYAVATVNDKGQIVIPKEMRKNENISKNDKVFLMQVDGQIIMRKLDERPFKAVLKIMQEP